jgi:hypothetical protein
MNGSSYPPVANTERQILEYVSGQFCDRLPIETTEKWMRAAIENSRFEGPFGDALREIEWTDGKSRHLTERELAKKIHKCFEDVLAGEPVDQDLEFPLLVCFMRAWSRNTRRLYLQS